MREMTPYQRQLRAIRQELFHILDDLRDNKIIGAYQAAERALKDAEERSDV